MNRKKLKKTFLYIDALEFGRKRVFKSDTGYLYCQLRFEWNGIDHTKKSA